MIKLCNKGLGEAFMLIALYPYRNVVLLSPGGIISHKISHYQFVLSRLFRSSFNSSRSRKPLTESILMHHEVPHQDGHFIDCDIDKRNCG